MSQNVEHKHQSSVSRTNKMSNKKSLLMAEHKITWSAVSRTNTTVVNEYLQTISTTTQLPLLILSPINKQNIFVDCSVGCRVVENKNTSIVS